MSLADIQRDIQTIQDAYDGEDVRGALVSALTSMNNNTNGICEQAVAQAQTAATDAQEASLSATSSASSAASSASSAASDAARAESAAGQAVSGGVRSFNGRNGEVVPGDSDYTASMIQYGNDSNHHVSDELDAINSKINGLLSLTTISGNSMTLEGNGWANLELNGTKAGRWSPMGVVGFTNQINQVAQWKCVIPFNGGSEIPDAESGTSKVKVQVGIRNLGSSQTATFTPSVRVLWIKV